MSLLERNFWKRERRPRREAESTALASPLGEPERLFQDLFNNFWLAPFSPFEMTWGEFTPQVDVIEKEKEILVKAELPGMSEKDVQVSLAQDALTISGEKKTEEEHRSGNVYRMERSYGAFSRTIPLPVDVDVEKADATFKNGVLTITLPKVAAAKESRKIKIKTQ